jgi:predicted  nucleic acid-binding Zn-ribbon protein
MFECQECGRIFPDHLTAFAAAIKGCPSCGSLDIDDPDEGQEEQAPNSPEPPSERVVEQFANDIKAGDWKSQSTPDIKETQE